MIKKKYNWILIKIFIRINFLIMNTYINKTSIYYLQIIIINKILIIRISSWIKKIIMIINKKIKHQIDF